MLIDELEVDIEGTVSLGGPAITRGKGDSVFGRRSGDEGVVGRTTRDAERRQPGMQPVRFPGTEEQRAGEIVGEQSGDSTGGAAARRWQPGQNREGLEGRMPAQSATTAADGLPGGLMVLVPGGREGNGDASVDQQLGLVIAGRHRAASGRGRR